MKIPIAPGKDFLKATGFFYIAAGGLSIMIALVVRFAPITSMSLMVAEMLPMWKFTAVNNAFVLLERFHLFVPGVNSLSNLRAAHPNWPEAWQYQMYLSFPIDITVWSTVIAFVAVFIGMAIVFMGIMAVRQCEPSKHTKLLVIFALVNFAMMAISTVLFVSFFAVLGCVIAVFYFVGAFKNYTQICPFAIKNP